VVENASGCVLLVEDDDEVARIVGDMLAQLGYHVMRAANASSALHALANGRQVDLVFTDIVMPGGMDGVRLARELRARLPGLPVVLTSGHPGAASRDIEAAGLKVLAKPYRLEELRVVLAEALHAPPTDERASPPAAGTGRSDC
jgi:CheY-like chemotaxis protein